MSRFTQAVYSVVRQIERGQVMTYREVAMAIGAPRAARAVGSALHRNSTPVIIPCHRVVKSNGDVGGYVHGRERKEALLQSEGVGVRNGCVSREFFIQSLSLHNGKETVNK